MSVTKTAWLKMTWNERINEVLSSLKITIAELACRLGVSRRTVEYWMAHKKVPKEKYIRILRSWCVSDPFDDLKEEAYMAMHTMSTDASARLLENACVTKDPMMLSMAMHCIAIKLAALITYNSSTPQNALIYITALYGNTSTSIKVANATLNPDTLYSSVSINLPMDNTNMFTLTVKQISPNMAESSFAFIVSDKALLATAKRINKHLSLN